jgi:hypothetical protein
MIPYAELLDSRAIANLPQLSFLPQHCSTCDELYVYASIPLDGTCSAKMYSIICIGYVLRFGGRCFILGNRNDT